MKRNLYCAYGSNLDKRQMNYRCPSNSFYATGKIIDYRLTLPFYADIEPSAGDSTPCVLYEVGAEDEMSLNSYEGVNSGCYKKIQVQVATDDGIHEAFAYRMTDAYKKYKRPVRAGYYQQMIEAYKHLGFDYNSLERLISDNEGSASKHPKDKLLTRVFVYGTLKKGMGNHSVMIEAKGRFLGTTKVRGYACINTPWFPYAFKKDEAIIEGEVFAIPKENIYILDTLEGYPGFYNREITKTDLGHVWIYFLDCPDPKHISEYGLTEKWDDK